MAETRNPFKRIRLVYRRSSPLLKGVVIGCIVLAMVALIVIGSAIVQEREKREADRALAAQLEQENRKLNEDISQLGTIEGIQRIARERLGLLPEGAQIITPQQDQPN